MGLCWKCRRIFVSNHCWKGKRKDNLLKKTWTGHPGKEDVPVSVDVVGHEASKCGTTG
jgi:hypothetical protein